MREFSYWEFLVTDLLTIVCMKNKMFKRTPRPLVIPASEGSSGLSGGGSERSRSTGSRIRPGPQSMHLLLHARTVTDRIQNGLKRVTDALMALPIRPAAKGLFQTGLRHRDDSVPSLAGFHRMTGLRRSKGHAPDANASRYAGVSPDHPIWGGKWLSGTGSSGTPTTRSAASG